MFLLSREEARQYSPGRDATYAEKCHAPRRHEAARFRPVRGYHDYLITTIGTGILAYH